MEQENKFELIVSIVNRGHSDNVVAGAREAGARGGTIFYGRGTGNSEKDSIMGVSIEPEKEIVLTLTKKEDSFNNKMFWYMVIATVPGAVLGFLLDDVVKNVFREKIWLISEPNSKQDAIQKWFGLFFIRVKSSSVTTWSVAPIL